MALRRMERVNEQLKREIAGALYRVMNEPGFDLSAVTVTRVLTGRDFHTARVLISIRDHAGERTRMLHQIRRHLRELREVVRRNVVMKHIPELLFELDESIEQGDHVLELISRLEQDLPPEPDPAP